MACMTSGASSVTLQSLYWRSSNNFSVPAESSRVNWCSPARRLEDEILESRSHKGEVWSKRTALRPNPAAPRPGHGADHDRLADVARRAGIGRAVDRVPAPL